MSKYKPVEQQVTVEDGLDTTEIECLRDEMVEWRDNMEGTGLENTQKFEQVSEAADTLENVDSISFDDLWSAIDEAELREEIESLTFVSIQFKVRSRRQSPSRSTRLSNAVSGLTGAIDAIEALISEREQTDKLTDIQTELDNLRGLVEEVDGVEFPGMF